MTAEAVAQAQLAEQQAARAQSSAPVPPASASKLYRGDKPAEDSAPPRDERELRSRIEGAVPEGLAILELRALGDGTRFAIALGRGLESSLVRLMLFDLSSRPAGLIADHEFAVAELAAGAEREAAKPAIHQSPRRIGQVLALATASGAPLALAELEGETPGEVLLACGWWIRPTGPTFVCAPKMSFRSTYQALGTLLVERWAVELPGEQMLDEINDSADARQLRARGRSAPRVLPFVAQPPSDQPGAGVSGRVMRFSRHGWEDVSAFHCLGVPLDDALRETSPGELAEWQRESVRRLVGSARRLSTNLETEQALSRLRDALNLDRCDPELWRLHGRLEYEAGSAARAAPSLAVALALGPRRDPTILDLADALAVLNSGTQDGRLAWRMTRAILGDQRATRALLEGGPSKAPQAPPALDEDRSEPAPGQIAPVDSPRDLALVLYTQWLRRTAAQGAVLDPARRRVRQQIAALGGDVPEL